MASHIPPPDDEGDHGAGDEGLPDGDFEIIRRSFHQFAMSYAPPESLIDKLNEEQLSQLIENAKESEDRAHATYKFMAWMTFGKVCLALVFVIVICLMFVIADRVEFIDRVLYAGLGLLAGLGIGQLRRQPPATDVD